jgi:hypothetical protein
MLDVDLSRPGRLSRLKDHVMISHRNEWHLNPFAARFAERHTQVSCNKLWEFKPHAPCL